MTWLIMGGVTFAAQVAFIVLGFNPLGNFYRFKYDELNKPEEDVKSDPEDDADDDDDEEEAEA